MRSFNNYQPKWFGLPYHWVYLIVCEDGFRYIGQTNDILRRKSEHFSGQTYALDGHQPKVMKVLACNLTRTEAQNLEKVFSQIYRAKGFQVYSY